MAWGDRDRRWRDDEDDEGRQHIGIWAELALKEMHVTANGRKLSTFEMLLYKEFERAINGEIPAIKIVLRTIQTDMKRLKWRYEEEQAPLPSERSSRDERHVELALMMLDMAAVDNEAVGRLMQLEPERYGEAIRNLAPSRLERWVYDYAVANTTKFVAAGPLEMVEKDLVAPDRSDVSLWDVHKARIKQDLMRLRGPGATRFTPGQSGNRRGRPRKPVPHLCYGGFLTDPIDCTVNGRTVRASRADLLMIRLTERAKTDRKIAKLILPILMQIREQAFRDYDAPIFIDRY